MENQKKISFSFAKSSKPLNILTTKPEEKSEIELIECLEGQSIKIKNSSEKKKGPLVIPLRDNAKNLLDRIKNSKNINTENEDQRPDSELTLDELAARELIREAKQQPTDISETKVHSLPVVNDKLPNHYDKESTIDDYNDVPIYDFGMAMLRGMGWSDSTGIGKDNKQVINMIEPELRPKGMGLGANKIVNLKKISMPVDKEGNELTLVKGALAKIIAGKHNGNYCEVLGLDDESGRIIVKTAIQQNILSLNEFLVMPVTKEEYHKCSKILNNAKYEEYKAKSNMNEHKSEQVEAESSKMEYKSTKRKHDVGTSEGTNQNLIKKHKKLSKINSNSSSDDDYKYKKRSNRSPSPYKYKSHVSKPKIRSHNKEHISKQETSTFTKRQEVKNSESSDSDDHKAKRRNGSKNYDERSKRKKSKKHKKYRQDSYSSDEEYKKQKKKNKKYHKHASNSSDEDISRKSKYKYKQNKNGR